jgi:single-strand DNA-binding protein
MNAINLTGNICADLEVKSTTSGKAVLNFTLAVKRPYSKDTTDFIPMVVWEQGAEYLGRYARKGSKIAASGKLTTRKYQDKDGNNRTVFEVLCDTVEIMDSKNDAQGAGNAAAAPYIPDAYTAPQSANMQAVDEDSDLPF